MPNFLSYNNAEMKIITPFTNRATIIGVLNNNWVMKKDGEIPDIPDIPDVSPVDPENPDNSDNPDNL